MTLIEQLSNQIINDAAEKARNQLRPDYATENYERSYLDLQNIIRKQEEIKPILDPAAFALDMHQRARAVAATFQLAVINSLVATHAINQNIDSFFDNPENADFFSDMSKEQADNFRQQLKDTVTERLAVKAKTEPAQKFVNDLTEKFNSTVVTERDRNYFERSAMFPIITTVRAIQNGVEPELSVPQSESHTAAKITADAMVHDYLSLREERETVQKYSNEVIIPYEGKDGITVDKFCKHFEENKLTSADKKWGEYFFDKEVDINKDAAPDFSQFMIDGLPMFTEQQIKESNPAELKTQVIGRALQGEDIVYRDGIHLGHIKPTIERDLNRKESLIDRIIDFFKDLLGIDRTPRDRIINERASFGHANFQVAPAPLREKVTFEELSGKTTVDKAITKPAPEKNVPEKKAPEKSQNTPTLDI